MQTSHRRSIQFLGMLVPVLTALVIFIGVGKDLLAQSTEQPTKTTLTRPPFKYDWDPNGDVCGTTGPSPNQVSIDFDSANGGRQIEVEVRKCDDSDFQSDGRVELMVENDREWREGYRSGEDVIRFDIDPVAEKGFLGPHRYIAHVYSDDQSTIAKHTGEILAWEEYDTPPDVQTNLEYNVSPDSARCGDTIELRLRPNHAAHNITAEITKCDHDTFNQSGKYYIAVNTSQNGTYVPHWGPFELRRGDDTYTVSFDPADFGLANAWHWYKVILYSDDYQIESKHSGVVSAIGRSPTPTPTVTNTPTPTQIPTATPIPTNTLTPTSTNSPTPPSTATPTSTATSTEAPIEPSTFTPTATATATATATGTAPPPADAVVVQAGQANGEPNATVIVPVWVDSGPYSAGAVSVEVGYDPAVVDLLDCDYKVTEGYSNSTCNGRFDDDNVGTDALRFNVADPYGVSGRNRAVDLHFRLVGQLGDSSDLSVVVRTAVDENGAVIPSAAQNGRVTIGDDVDPPPVCTLSLADAAIFTNLRQVVVRTNVPDAAQMMLSNDGSFAGASWQPYQANSLWQLSDPGQRITTLIVYARFRDTGGAELCNGTQSDDIIYDPLAPEVRSAIFVPRAVNAAGVAASGTLHLSAVDQVGGSGVNEVQVSEDAGFAGAVWQPYSTSVNVGGDVAGSVYVRVRDTAGNVSGSVRATMQGANRVYLPLVRK